MPEFDFQTTAKRLPKETPTNKWLQIFTYGITTETNIIPITTVSNLTEFSSNTYQV